MFLVGHFFRGNLVQRGKTWDLTESWTENSQKNPNFSWFFNFTPQPRWPQMRLWIFVPLTIPISNLKGCISGLGLAGFSLSIANQSVKSWWFLHWFVDSLFFSAVKNMTFRLSTWLHCSIQQSQLLLSTASGNLHLQAPRHCLDMRRWSLHGGARVNWTFIQKQLYILVEISHILSDLDSFKISHFNSFLNTKATIQFLSNISAHLGFGLFLHLPWPIPHLSPTCSVFNDASKRSAYTWLLRTKQSFTAASFKVQDASCLGAVTVRQFGWQDVWRLQHPRLTKDRDLFLFCGTQLDTHHLHALSSTLGSEASSSPTWAFKMVVWSACPAKTGTDRIFSLWSRTASGVQDVSREPRDEETLDNDNHRPGLQFTLDLTHLAPGLSRATSKKCAANCKD